MRREEILLCEGILRDYKNIRKSLHIRELELLTRGAEIERVDGGEKLAQQQRVLEDREYSELLHIAYCVKSAVSALPVHLQKTVILIYIVGMNRESACHELHCSGKTIRRWSLKAIEQLHAQLAGIYPHVRRWRRREEKDVRSMDTFF